MVTTDFGTYTIRSLTGAEIARMKVWLSKGENWSRRDEALVGRSVVDPETLEPLYRPTAVENGVLAEWNNALLSSLGEACDIHSGYSERKYSMEDVQELAKN